MRIFSSEMLQFVRFLVELLHKAHNSQITTKQLNWFTNLLTQKERDKLVEQVDPKYPKFTHMNTFRLVVPYNYNHATQLENFDRGYRHDFEYFDNNLTDQNYFRVSYQLAPGEIWVVRIFEVEGITLGSECVEFLKERGASLVGAQGLSLVYQLKKDELPIGWTLSVDEKRALWQKGDHICSFAQVPAFQRSKYSKWGPPSGRLFDFYYRGFSNGFGTDYLLGFFKE